MEISGYKIINKTKGEFGDLPKKEITQKHLSEIENNLNLEAGKLGSYLSGRQTENVSFEIKSNSILVHRAD